MKLCKTILSLSSLLVFFFSINLASLFPYIHFHNVSYSSSVNKKKIVIFPFKNNTNFPNLQGSIPDVLRGELFRDGVFEIVDKKRTFKEIWRLGISNSIKIDNVPAINKENFTNQDVDLFSQLDKTTVERISSVLEGDYAIKGVVNQFGSLLRVELYLEDVHADETIDSLSTEVTNVEDIPNAIKHFVPTIIADCVQENIEEISDEAVSGYREGIITFEKAETSLKEVALFAPGSIYAKAVLLALYIEQGYMDEAVGRCKAIIEIINENPPESMDVFMRVGVDPFAVLGDFYEENGKFRKAADVYNNAIRITPFNKPVYYKKLGASLLKLGDNVGAIDALQKSVELNKMDFDAHYMLATAFDLENMAPKALYEYKQSLKHTGGITKGLPIKEIKERIRELE